MDKDEEKLMESDQESSLNVSLVIVNLEDLESDRPWTKIR